MKNLNKVLLVALTISSTFSFGQIYTPSASVLPNTGSPTNVGIGINSPTSLFMVDDLSTNGRVDLRTNSLYFGSSNNISSSAMSGSFGYWNSIAESKYSFDFGYKNSIASSSSTSFISGYGNRINESSSSSIFGLKNSLYGDQSSGTIGENNQINKSKSTTAFGFGNSLANDNSSGTIGEENRIDESSWSTAFGYKNVIESSTSVAIAGQSNLIRSSDQSVVFGEDNKIINNCHGCAAIGGHNVVNAGTGSKYMFAIGATKQYYTRFYYDGNKRSHCFCQQCKSSWYWRKHNSC